MTIKVAITPLEIYLREQIAADVSGLKKLHDCTVERVGLSQDLSFVSYLLELLWLEATRPFVVEDIKS